MIIARIEEIIAGYSVSEAIEKAFAAVRAGADGVMIHSKDKSGEDMITQAIILADGFESPFGAWTEIEGVSLIERSIQKLVACGIEEIIIGVNGNSKAYDALASKYHIIKTVQANTLLYLLLL